MNPFKRTNKHTEGHRRVSQTYTLDSIQRGGEGGDGGEEGKNGNGDDDTSPPIVTGHSGSFSGKPLGLV